MSTGSPPSARADSEAARLEAEHQLALVFNSARDMMLLARVEPDVLFRVVSVNRTYLETIRAAGFDFVAGDFEGRTFDEKEAMFGTSAGATAQNRARYQQVLATRKPLEFAEVTLTPKGTFHGRTTITPILDEAGQCGFFLYSSQDVTERMRAEQAMQESEEKFAKVFLASPDAISVHELETGRCVDANLGYLRLFGVTREELIGKLPAELGIWIDPAERKAFVECLRREGSVRNFPAQVRLEGGRTGLCELSAERIELGGRPHNVTVLRDITARTQMEAALQESEARFATAFRASPDIIVITDYATGEYLEVNAAQENCFGYTREELIGHKPDELGSVHDCAVQDEIKRRLERDGHVREMKVQGRTRDGRPITVSMSAEILTVGGRKCMLRVSRDVTLAEQAGQALRASEEKFSKAFRSSPSPLTITEIATGRYIEVNLGFERVTGYRREDVIGRTSLEVGIWEDPADRDEMVRRLQAGGEVRDLEFRFRGRDGQKLVMRCSFENIELAGRACLLTVLADITEQRQAEQELRESEERVASAFRATPDAMAIADLETGLYLEVNEGFERLFGYTRAEVIGRSATDLKLLADPSVSALVRNRLAAGERVRDLEMAVFTKTGEQRTILHSVERIKVSGRECLLRVSRDITERKRAEQVLRQSEEKFAKAFRASPSAICISELITGNFVEVNEGFERLSGYSRAELIGRSAEKLNFWAEPGDRTRMLEELERAGMVRNMRTRVRGRSGEVRDFLLSVETVEIGRQTCLVILGHDVSEQLLAEKALRESEEKFAIAFRASPIPLTIVELATGRFIEVNHSFERVTGYTRAEAIGRTTLELGLWPNGVGREAFAARLDREGIVRNLIVVFRTRDGRDIHTRCNSEVIQLGGQRCILSLIEDISEEMKAEEQKALLEGQLRQSQKLEALGTLAGGIAHDFNNILTAIVVNQELALMDIDNPPELRERLGEISRASNRAKDLVRQILAFSRQQSEQVRVQQRLGSIIHEAMSLVRASLPAMIEIDQDISSEAPAVFADATQVHQIVMNLCTNAAHAMRARPGRLTVRLAARSLDETQARLLPGLLPGAYAQVTIADTGHGMTKAVLARIFEPFFTTKGPGEGTGLGLAVVHGIMKDHGGGIFVDSTPDVGTKFDLFFPAALGTEDAAVPVQEDLMFGRGESVLVVDDEPSVCDAVGAMLGKLNYRVESFTDAEQGLARFKAGPADFDLLLTDRTMPRLTGPQLISLVQAIRPGMPALVMSGLSSPSPGGSDPAVSYRLVPKPLDIVELSQAVRAALIPASS